MKEGGMGEEGRTIEKNTELDENKFKKEGSSVSLLMPGNLVPVAGMDCI